MYDAYAIYYAHRSHFSSSREVIRSHSGDVRLLAYPNSGEGWDAANDSWMGEPDLQPSEFGEAAASWVAAGMHTSSLGSSSL